MTDILSEKIIQSSPRGKKIIEPLQSLQQMEQLTLADISLFIVHKVNDCITKANSDHKLPSAAQCAMWTAFHKLKIGVVAK